VGSFPATHPRCHPPCGRVPIPANRDIDEPDREAVTRARACMIGSAEYSAPPRAPSRLHLDLVRFERVCGRNVPQAREPGPALNVEWAMGVGLADRDWSAWMDKSAPSASAMPSVRARRWSGH
jgi:hypothetical protein